MIPLNDLYLAILAFGAAVINGAVGYGFSSTVTPIAILWFSNKVLNPALVIVEVVVNIVLLTRERQHISATWPRARPIIRTLLPGVILGTFGLAFLAVNDVKVIVYLIMFPLIVLQLRGVYRPLKNEERSGAIVGPGIGFLYSLTTISGPPLALFLRNQGLSKNEFRCTIAQIRVAESTMTLGTYLAFDAFLGSNLVSFPSLSLLPFLFVPVLIGIPLGTVVVRAISPEFFRRFIMMVDGIFVSYGLSRVVLALTWLTLNESYALFGILVLVIGILALVALSRVAGGPFGTGLPNPSGPGGPGSGPGPPGARDATPAPHDLT